MPKTLTTCTFAFAFWLAAALLVAAAHLGLDPVSVTAGAVAAITAIVLAAFAYSRLSAPDADVAHALGVGIAWLILAIVTEIVFTRRLGHGWFSLLGSPAHPLLRNLFLFIWVFTPALFARKEVVSPA